MDNSISLAGKIYLYSGKLSFLRSGFSLFKTPTGENVNSQKLAEILIIATVNDLLKRKVIEVREETRNAILGSFPILILKKVVSGETEIGFARIFLEYLKEEKELTKLTADIIGRIMFVPEEGILHKVENEFSEGFFEIVEVKKFFLMKQKEKVWNADKINPIIVSSKTEVEKEVNETSSLTWFNTALRNIRLGITQQRQQPKRDDD